jgi:hypothetical protein
MVLNLKSRSYFFRTRFHPNRSVMRIAVVQCLSGYIVALPFVSIELWIIYH